MSRKLNLDSLKTMLPSLVQSYVLNVIDNYDENQR